MCQVDGDVATVWDASPRVARKVHECSCCGFGILPGTHYLHISALNEGSWSRARICFGCWVMQDDFGEAHHYWPWPTQLVEDLEECVRWDTKAGARQWRDHLAAFWRRCRHGAWGREARSRRGRYTAHRHTYHRRSA